MATVVVIYLIAGLFFVGISAEFNLFGLKNGVDMRGLEDEYEEPIALILAWPVALLLLWVFGDPYKNQKT